MEKDNCKKAQQVLTIILFANLFVAGLKIVIGLIIQSASVLADGLHSLTDGTSNIIGLIGIKLASKPTDNEHPYGHNKFETLSGLFISFMLFFVGIKVMINAVYRFKNPIVPSITIESLVVIILTLAINIFVSMIEYRSGKKLGSQVLVYDSMHTKSDIYVTIGVLVTLVSVKIGLPSMIDPIASIIVSGFIFHAAFSIYKENSNVLLDRAVVDKDDIRILVMSYKEVKEAHKIRSRGSQNNMYIDLHLMVEPDLSIEESHVLVHDIEKTIKGKVNPNAQVIAHLEPFTKEEKYCK